MSPGATLTRITVPGIGAVSELCSAPGAEWSWRAAEGKAYCYDVHATVLHLLGIDHEQLAVRHNGIDRRLTDVHGLVIEDVLA